MLINVNEATGGVLDYLVARAMGAEFQTDSVGAITAKADGENIGGFSTRIEGGTALPNPSYSPSRDGSQWVPVFERMMQANGCIVQHWPASNEVHTTFLDLTGHKHRALGSNVMESTLRCFALSALGSVAEVPDVIVTGNNNIMSWAGKDCGGVK